jgi:transcriptional regulator with XRE-family HTH domain
MKNNSINKIKEIRESQGLSQESVAYQLNISQQAYSRIEKNPDSASVKRLRDLSNVFGVSLASLIGEEDTYIQQNFQQQGGHASSVVHVHGTMNLVEKEMYEGHLKDLRQQIETLTEIIRSKHS